MSRHAANEISSQTSVDAGLSVTGRGPAVEVTTNVGIATSTARSSAREVSSTYAKNVVSNSISRVMQSVSSRTSRSLTIESEENNVHRFAATDTGHITGVYQWLEKTYHAQVWNYGKRLMLEFIVPEPSAFYKYSQGANVLQGENGGPLPLDDDFTFSRLDTWNYRTYTADYHVADIKQPPAHYVYVTNVIKIENPGEKMFHSETHSIEIPEGYKAEMLTISGIWDHMTNAYFVVSTSDSGSETTTEIYREPFLSLACGGKVFTEDEPDTDKSDHKDYSWVTLLHGETGALPIGVTMRATFNTTITVEVRCKRQTQHFTNWQIETYSSIVVAYDQLKREYEENIASKKRGNMSMITGQSSQKKRALEQEELKRGCLQILTGQHFLEFDAMQAPVAPFNYPEFDLDEANNESDDIRFFEQCFEWEHMTYVFYPYFWGRKKQWVHNSKASDDERSFDAFLRAGASRVMLPVRPEFERAASFFLKFGGIWGGEAPPMPGEDLYFSIADEQALSTKADMDNLEPYGDAWTYRVPTSLVKLRPDSDLPDLPSWPAPSDSAEPDADGGGTA
ncbi:MAG: hypothetical protein O3C57_06570 [Verrucomicrobia bacterium]|nr:hypothetical protein [Verrucomicrobiota bacterium]